MKSGIHLSVRPLMFQLHKRLTGIPTLEESAVEVVEIAPGEVGERPEALFLDNQLSKVRRVQEETDEALERSRITRGPVTHQPTLGYRLKDVHLIQGTVFVGRHQHRQTYERPSPLPRLLGRHLAQASLPSSREGNRYFGHFIIDDANTALLARDYAPVQWTSCGAPLGSQALRYLELYGLPHETVQDVRIDEAWLFQDFAMNSSKRARQQVLRSLVRSLPGKRTGHGVFFRRRGAGVPRGLVNEAEIEEVLLKQGFEIIDIVGATVEDIVYRCKDASLVVGVEGSQLVHGLLAMAEGATLLCLQPPYRFNNVLKDHADALGFRYAFVVGEGTECSFWVDGYDLLRTLDLVRTTAG